MKRFMIVFAFILSTVLQVSAQDLDLERFYMPQIQSKEDCSKYIGKRVCVFDYSVGNIRRSDARKFGGNRFYTINKIKVGDQIVFHLVSDYGFKYKVKINNGGKRDYRELSSCNIFFLWDDFEAYKKGLIGKVYKNSNNEDVAVLENIELIPRRDEDPVLVLTLRSKINDEEFICFPQDAAKLCEKIGTIVSNPKVKHSYRVLSASNSEYSNPEHKYIYAESPRYRYENTATGEIGQCLVEDILSAPFAKDLSGKYISLLAEVEKPANPEIRYGETTLVPSEEGMSKFHYRDNVIDIIIFAGRSDFDFTLQNISENSIKIIWDEAVFVNFDGSSEKVMHKGTKYSEKNSSQPPTTIIKNAKWEDSVTPTHLVYYREGTEYIKGGWSTYSMYPKEAGLQPGQIKLMLPIQIKDVINEYVFVFDVQYIYNHPERLNLDE